MACPTTCIIAVFNCCNAALWLFTNNPMLACAITNADKTPCGRRMNSVATSCRPGWGIKESPSAHPPGLGLIAKSIRTQEKPCKH